jgi:hypothetical protein
MDGSKIIKEGRIEGWMDGKKEGLIEPKFECGLLIAGGYGQTTDD